MHPAADTCSKRHCLGKEGKSPQPELRLQAAGGSPVSALDCAVASRNWLPVGRGSSVAIRDSQQTPISPSHCAPWCFKGSQVAIRQWCAGADPHTVRKVITAEVGTSNEGLQHRAAATGGWLVGCRSFQNTGQASTWNPLAARLQQTYVAAPAWLTHVCTIRSKPASGLTLCDSTLQDGFWMGHFKGSLGHTRARR